MKDDKVEETRRFVQAIWARAGLVVIQARGKAVSRRAGMRKRMKGVTDVEDGAAWGNRLGELSQ